MVTPVDVTPVDGICINHIFSISLKNKQMIFFIKYKMQLMNALNNGDVTVHWLNATQIFI